MADLETYIVELLNIHFKYDVQKFEYWLPGSHQPDDTDDDEDGGCLEPHLGTDDVCLIIMKCSPLITFILP